MEWKKKGLVEVFDMACPIDKNICDKKKEKRKDQGLQPVVVRLVATKSKSKVAFHPLVVGVTGALGNIRKEALSVMEDEKETDNIVREMQKTVVVYTQQMIHRILTGLL